MSGSTEVRKDNKGRRLFEGETQELSGRYNYTYRDKFNQRKRVYSWKLQPSDKLPAGKKECKSLRELEQEVKKDLHDEIDRMASKRTTLNERFELYMERRTDLAPSTRANYKRMYDLHVRDDIGKMSISDINYSTLEKFYTDLIEKKGFLPNSVSNIHTVLNPVFDRAVSDNLIRRNDCGMIMRTLKKTRKWKKTQSKIEKKVKVLSKEQQRALLDFIENSEKYKSWINIVTFLLGSGVRVGECSGLRWDDVDFENGIIHIEHDLVYRTWEDGTTGPHMFDLKTENAERDIPMLPPVRKALLEEYNKQLEEGFSEVTVDGFGKWVFLNRFRSFILGHNINKALYRIVRDYNDKEMTVAETEERTPRLMPHLHNHLLRHTFCTRLAEANVPLQATQKIMGHGDIQTTIDIYTAVGKKYIVNTLDEYSGEIF